MGAAYSSLGQTKVLYATSLVLLGAKAIFLRRKPSVLAALEEISEMCWPQTILSEMVIPRYFADWTFSKFWIWREISKRICLWCWCRVTLIEWHLATLNFICHSASLCPKLVRSSCMIKQSWIEHMFLYRTQSSANRQTEYLMLSGRSYIIIRNRIGPRTILGVNRITLGLDLRLDHLLLLVECAQRAMSWSTCGGTLLSHKSPICIIASCVVPCQRPMRNPLWSNLYAFVHNSQPHPGCWWYGAHTGPTESRRTSDFGNHADSQQVCYLRLSVCWCYGLIYALGFSSRCMLATPVYN